MRTRASLLSLTICFFLAKIQETARKMNVKVEFVKTDKDLLERMKQNGEEKPSLIIFDLNNVNASRLRSFQAQEQAQERDLDHRVPLPRAGRFEAEGARGGMRHGPAPFGLLAEPAPVAAPSRRRGRRSWRAVDRQAPDRRKANRKASVGIEVTLSPERLCSFDFADLEILIVHGAAALVSFGVPDG